MLTKTVSLRNNNGRKSVGLPPEWLKVINAIDDKVIDLELDLSTLEIKVRKSKEVN
jgi:hypothetical protein